MSFYTKFLLKIIETLAGLEITGFHNERQPLNFKIRNSLLGIVQIEHQLPEVKV